MRFCSLRLPVDYRVWSRLDMFRHGANDSPSYGFEVFSNHYGIARPTAGFVALELGPGDALAGAVVAPAFGAGRTYLVDVGCFASPDVRIYKAQAQYCIEKGLSPPDLEGAASLDEVLLRCNATYMTEGLASLREMESESVDFIYSQSCLEHIRRAEFPETLRQMRRVLRPGGVASHSIDFKDHLQKALNNLRFSEKIWEGDMFADRGFYTNRIRPAQMLAMFEAAGFSVEIIGRYDWEAIPTPRSALHPDFRDLPDQELLTHRLVVRCT